MPRLALLIALLLAGPASALGPHHFLLSGTPREPATLEEARAEAGRWGLWLWTARSVDIEVLAHYKARAEAEGALLFVLPPGDTSYPQGITFVTMPRSRR